MGDYFGKAQIIAPNFFDKAIGNGMTIKYVGSNGQNREYNTSDRAAIRATKLLNDYYKDMSNGIDKKAALNFRNEASKEFPPLHGDHAVHTDWNRLIRDAISDFTDVDSDGSTRMTPREIAEFYERIENGSKY